MIGHGNQKYTLILNKLWTPDSQALQINSAQTMSSFAEFWLKPAKTRHCKIILKRTLLELLEFNCRNV